MLTRYFGFREDPFGAAPDPRFLYSSRTHREALASLQYAFFSNRGFTALIAPPGMGKTTLLFEFLERIRNQARTAFLFNAQCEAGDLLGEILRDAGLVPGHTMAEMLRQLNTELAGTARKGRRFVVVVDEAQNLSEPSLELLRLLTNFETSRAKLMQIVLSGQPRLADTLLRPGLVQLRQRIATICRLEPFTPEDTYAYIAHRLRVAGYSGADLFTAAALRQIAASSEGIPRNVNTLCFNALSLCCGLGRKKVDEKMVNEAIEDLRLNEEAAADQEPVALSLPEAATRGDKGAGLRRLWAAALLSILLVGAGTTFWAVQTHKVATAGSILQSPPAADSQTGKAAAVKPPAAARDNTITITVAPKETLSGISMQRVGGFDSFILRQIQELNPDLANPDLILPGQRILLPNPQSGGREPQAQPPRGTNHEQEF